MEKQVSHLPLSALFLVVVATGALKLQTTHPPVTLRTGTSCSNVIPGLFRQSRGVDVSRLELMPLDMMESEDGFRSPVIDFTCDKGNTRPIGGVSYQQPDQVWLVSNIPSGSMTGSVQIMTSSNEVRESFDVNAGIGVNSRKFAFSASSSYSKVQNTVLKEEKNVQSLGATFSSWQIELQHVDVLDLGVDAQREVSELPATYIENTGAYERFISQFGTHYISEGKFGGLMMMYTETNALIPLVYNLSPTVGGQVCLSRCASGTRIIRTAWTGAWTLCTLHLNNSLEAPTPTIPVITKTASGSSRCVMRSEADGCYCCGRFLRRLDIISHGYRQSSCNTRIELK
ncbi:hypothetical protein BaRGS_00034299 [Batillaria attramentaria]|uniref:MACPF domain-containing protein n=1 Tax=Batillaria attramentaria TaxID=370345 RepID=A0ABD0JHS6_9CAEN